MKIIILYRKGKITALYCIDKDRKPVKGYIHHRAIGRILKIKAVTVHAPANAGPYFFHNFIKRLGIELSNYEEVDPRIINVNELELL